MCWDCLPSNQLSEKWLNTFWDPILSNPLWLSGKESACNAGDVGSIPGSARSPGGGNGSPLQYSHLGNPWTEEAGGLQSMGSQSVGHDWAAEQEQVNTCGGCGKRGEDWKAGHARPSPASSCPRGVASLQVAPHCPCHLRSISGPSGSAQFVSGSAQVSFTSFVSHLSCYSLLAPCGLAHGLLFLNENSLFMQTQHSQQQSWDPLDWS